ncbi:MAG: hypothetical protein ACOYKE_03700, partial [Ferruginibacter sp.]
MMQRLTISIILSSFLVTANAQNVGIGTSNPTARLHVLDSSVVFSADGAPPSLQNNPPVSGPGRRMMWYADKAAFRVGYVSANSWNRDSVGDYSFASGANTKAKGFASTAMGNITSATGNVSTAMGYFTNASGGFSTALGYFADASGTYAIAIGNATTASGNNATVMGENTVASGNNSTAMGKMTVASGNNSTAFGNSNNALGDFSTTMGWANTAPSYGETALGLFNTTYTMTGSGTVYNNNDRLFSIGNGSSVSARSNALTILKNGRTGIGTTTPLARLHVTDSSVAFSATGDVNAFGVFRNPPISGEGRRLMWYADKAAFRVGYVSNNVWDKDSIGKYSNAFGSNTKAIGQGSFAAGNSTVASGFYSAALNVLSTASSYSETAIGQFNTLDPAASPDIWT